MMFGCLAFVVKTISMDGIIHVRWTILLLIGIRLLLFLFFLGLCQFFDR